MNDMYWYELTVNMNENLTLGLPTFFVTRTTKGGGSYDPPLQLSPTIFFLLNINT